MALTKCNECGHDISTLATSCPKCGAPVGNRPQAMACARCNVQLVAREKTSAVSGGGILGALGFLIGLGVAFASPLLGVGIIAASIATGVLLRPKKLIMVCPRCRTSG